MASIQGTAGNDTIIGTDANDTLVGLAGADRIDGGIGDDLIASGAIDATGGAALRSSDPGTEVDTLIGGAGNDMIFAGYGDVVDGGSGVNLLALDFAGAPAGARLSFRDPTGVSIGTSPNGTGGATITNIAGLTYVSGSAFADQIDAYLSPQYAVVVAHTTILGLGGDDTIMAGSGTDSILGGDGNDAIFGRGAETIYGEAGNDRIFAAFGIAYGGDGDDNLEATENTSMDGIAILYGGNGRDGLRAASDRGTLMYGEGDNDGLNGGNGNDSMYGGDGADALIGYGGADLMVGGNGNDIYYAQTADTIVEGVNEGADVVYATDQVYTLAEGVYVETITSLSQYRFDAQTLTGNALSQEIIGDQGANLLTGSTVRTIEGDTFRGLGGNDTLVGNAGRDLLDGGDGADVMLGGAWDDTLLGGAGDDTLNGGIGSDRLEGGAGNDTYLVDNEVASDQVIEAVGGGNDIVYTLFNYALGDTEVENLAAAEATGTLGIMLQGNQFGQAIAGNYGDNLLTGYPGLGGGDILIGLRGNDTYTIDAPNVLIVEAAGDIEGNDTAVVLPGGSGFVLNGESYVEKLVAFQGTDPINITGNMLSQRIDGNAGDNVLSTGGGGIDTLDGGLGNDTYRVHGTVSILDHGGTDILYTSGTFRLFTNAGLEAISTAVQAGTEAIDLTGNEVAQTIVGNYGTNVLDGRGGNDTLIGLQGADTFAFTSAPGAGNVDTIQDFTSGTDKIGLASDIFAAVTSGGIVASEFVVGTAATTADTRLIYNQTTGQLFYDADGNGAGAAVLFAQLGAGTALSAADFVAVAPTS